MESNVIEFDNPRDEAAYKEGLATKCEATNPGHPLGFGSGDARLSSMRAAADAADRAADRFDQLDEE